MSTFEASILLLAITIIGCFVAGLITRNYSHVDRLWSILPPVYGTIWLFEFQHLSYIIPCILVILWGIRLSFNFARRGGYRYIKGKGFVEEDYRWPILKEKIPNRFIFELFNLVFICGFQLILIFLFTLPLYYIGKANHTIEGTDYILYILLLMFLVGEIIADQQQYNYHSLKSKVKTMSENQNSSKEIATYNINDNRFNLGFNTYGLWKYSRHPNYFFELGQWVILWLLLVSASNKWHWSGIGAAVLILLFIGSTNFTEAITSNKYPKYKEWKRATPSIVPFLTSIFRLRWRKKFWMEL